jgi:hypothetical protein
MLILILVWSPLLQDKLANINYAGGYAKGKTTSRVTKPTFVKNSHHNKKSGAFFTEKYLAKHTTWATKTNQRCSCKCSVRRIGQIFYTRRFNRVQFHQLQIFDVLP